MAWDAGSIEAHLDVDTSPFRRGLEKAEAEAEEFARKHYTATVDINTRRSQDELAAVEQRLHSIEQATQRIGRGGGGAGGGNFLSRFAGANVPNPSLMALGLGAALPLAAPFAALGGGIAGGALSASVVGGLGLGAFGAGAKSSITTIQTDVKNLTKLTQQYNAATTNRQRAAVLTKEKALWDSLDPAQRKAVKNVQALEQSWHRYQKALEPQTFAVLGDAAKIANTGLGYLLPTAKAVGGELDTLAKSAEKALQGPFWKDFFGTFLPTEAPRAVDALGRTLGHLGTGVANLAVAFNPLAHLLEDGSTGLAAKFEKWTEGAGPGKFVSWVEKEGPPAAHALGELAKALGGLAAGFAPLGNVELKLLTPALTAVADFSKAHPEVIKDVGLALLTVGAGLKAINIAQGAAGVLSKIPGLGSKIPGGSGGGGGALGRALAGQGSSPANPLYVFVVDKAPGTSVKKTVEDAAKSGTVARIASKIGSHLPEIGRYGGIAGSLAYMYLNSPDLRGTQPNLPQAQLQAANRNPAVMKIYGGLLNQYEQTHPDAPATSGYLQSSLLRQAIAQAQKEAASGGTQAGLAFAYNAHTAIRGKLEPLIDSDITGALAGVAAQARARGMTLGQYITEGLAAGITAAQIDAVQAAQHTIDRVMAKFKDVPKISSPSKVTTYYGRMIAQGLSVGFLAEQPGVAAAFERGTKAGLAAIQQVAVNAQNQLQSDLQNRSGAAQGIASGLTGAYGLSNAFGPYGNVLNLGTYLGGGARMLRTEKTLLDRLHHKHLSADLLAQIAGMSPQQGVALATNILSGASGSIGSLNADQAAISRYAGQIGGSVSNAQYAQTIARDRASLATLQRIEKLMTEFVKDNPKATGKEVAAALNIVVKGHQVHGHG